MLGSAASEPASGILPSANSASQTPAVTTERIVLPPDPISQTVANRYSPTLTANRQDSLSIETRQRAGLEPGGARALTQKARKESHRGAPLAQFVDTGCNDSAILG